MGKKTKSTALGTIILILVLLGIGAASIYLFMNSQDEDQLDFVIHRSPMLRSEIVDANGESHAVTARFGVEIATDQEDTVDVDAMFDNMNRALADLDYNVLRQESGMELDYIKSQLLAALEGQTGVNTDAITAIYVTDFVTDITLPTETLPSNNSQRDRIFEGLFQNAD